MIDAEKLHAWEQDFANACDNMRAEADEHGVGVIPDAVRQAASLLRQAANLLKVTRHLAAK